MERFPARSGKWVTNSPAGGCSWGNDAAQGRAWRRPSARIRAPAMSSWRLASSDASSQFAGSATELSTRPVSACSGGGAERVAWRRSLVQDSPSFRAFTSAATGDSGTPGLGRCASAMDERRVRPRRPRHGRRLTDGTVVVTSHEDDGRVTHAIRYDESMEHVLEELEGEAAEAAYGIRGSEIHSPTKPGAD